jgi:hypothetical protein
MNTLNIIESGIARYISALEDLCFSWGWKPVRRSGHRSGFYWVPTITGRQVRYVLIDG